MSANGINGSLVVCGNSSHIEFESCCLGFALGTGFDRNNINNLAHRFKSPRFEIESDVENADAMSEPPD